MDIVNFKSEMPAEETVRIPAGKLIDFTYQTFKRVGAPEADAKLIAESFIDSDLRGVYSHGIMRLPIYIHHCRKSGPGGINPRAAVRIVKEGLSFAHVDGDNGMGHLVSIRAMEIAMAKAEKTGMAFVSVYNSNHNGAEGYFAKLAADRGMIGFFVTVGGRNIIAPTGGLTPLLGNNPFAYAIPAKRHYPVVLDMACSVVARGWILLAIKNGLKVPDGWAVDRDGNPTNDAREAYDGLVLPFGGYKGYALTLIGCILGGVLSGAAIGKEVTDLYGDFDRDQNVGHFMWALDLKSILPPDDFMERMDSLIDELKASRLAEGIERIYVPGEKEFLVKEENERLGIPVTLGVLKELNSMGDMKISV
ncbi:MAG: Ldh family oxidoreductase [Planctomycetota bacterium]|jgi:LDH2 family malate/lactate/ureidoglycolate dehydrogenase|nr:Ldh family oxidoreductase [Planctomycetota bacterium]